jgi:type IV pilus assembly protein PilQ
MRSHTGKTNNRGAAPITLALLAGLVCFSAGDSVVLAQEKEPERFDLSVKDMALTELLKMVAAKHRVSIVCSSDVTGQASVNFYDVTLDEALDAILTVNGLTFTRRGKVIHIHKPAEEVGQKITRTFELAWADPAQVATVLTELKGDDGTVVRSNDSAVLVVQDQPAILEQMAAVVAELDRKPKQVLITTWVVELGDSDLEKLGVNWASLDSLKVFEFTGEAAYQREKSNTNTGIDFAKAISTVVDLRAGVLADNEFNLLLSFFETLSKTKVVSEPRVMTLDNRPATIVVGTIVPIPLYDFAEETGTRILSGFQDQKVGTEVTVTPRVHTDGHITLDITPKVEQITDYIIVNGEKQRPIISTRQAQTTVMVKSGDIVVIGGLRDQNHTMQGSRVPYLHAIPLIGALFRNRIEDNRVTDLTIFIKPELFDDDNPLSVEEQEVFGSINPPRISGPDNDDAER